MSPTSLSVSQVRQQLPQLDGEGRKLYRLWAALPADRAVSEDEAFEIFEEAAGRQGDDAWASAMVGSLRLLGALAPGGAIRRSAAFPELPPEGHNAPGTAAYNAHCEALSAQERERHERADEAAQRDYREALARERRELTDLVREVVREEHVGGDRVLTLEAQVRQLRDRVNRLEGETHIAA